MTIVATVTAAAGTTLTNTATIAGGAGRSATRQQHRLDPDHRPGRRRCRTRGRRSSVSTRTRRMATTAPAAIPTATAAPTSQEFADGTHPRGFFRRFLAEGAANSFFDVRLALLNVGHARRRALLRRYLQPGGVGGHPVRGAAAGSAPHADARGSRQPHVGGFLDGGRVRSAYRVRPHDVLGRRLRLARGERACRNPSTIWYLAEGSTSGAVLAVLPAAEPESERDAGDRQVPAAARSGADHASSTRCRANSRTTIPIDEQGGVLTNTDVSAVITVAGPDHRRARDVSQHARPRRSRPVMARPASPRAAQSWFLAEGATGPFFDCFILLANPQTSPAIATINYLLSDGRTFTKAYTVPAQGRFTIWVDNEEIPAGSGLRPLDNVAVSSTDQRRSARSSSSGRCGGRAR